MSKLYKDVKQKKYTVLVNSLSKVTDFVSLCTKADCKVTCVRDDNVVSADSILGVLSMDITIPLEIFIEGTANQIELLIKQLEFLQYKNSRDNI